MLSCCSRRACWFLFISDGKTSVKPNARPLPLVGFSLLPETPGSGAQQTLIYASLFTQLIDTHPLLPLPASFGLSEVNK